MIKVAQDYYKAFDVAPKVKAGGLVTYSHVDPKNAGWFYGADAEGVKGFFPVAWFDIDLAMGVATAKVDYDATELEVRAGEVVRVEKENAMWYLVVNKRGETGWIPRESLWVQ